MKERPLQKLEARCGEYPYAHSGTLCAVDTRSGSNPVVDANKIINDYALPNGISL
jgi:hypothetical protein